MTGENEKVVAVKLNRIYKGESFQEKKSNWVYAYNRNTYGG